ncbi:patatin-like phospholipase family protein [Clostridium cellulovorans]|uniref:Patatin n=2 Tax=Clostridium cellulovorans TaxID=1493 RepID=D9SQ44_CLOC7|nr:patatin-like phospholipase family protein [Clostridium cellulovorans]ADL52180.1 Patatin [Clostridium cellulovorans 743B]BAV13193.1 patatin [Clostridium cellulovorans]
MESYGLVFGGGGAKGAYEIGVWKAIKEMNLKIDLVVGTSIGAINGAFFAQNDFNLALDLWTNITAEKIITFSEKLHCSRNILQVRNMPMLLKEIHRNKGIDTTELKNLLTENIDEEKIINSPIDYGLVTFSLKERKGMELFKEAIPRGKYIDYIIASCCFPGLKRQIIEDKEFIDGGFANNIPISMILSKGIKNIIAVDVKGPGFNKSISTAGANIITIKSNENLGGIFEINSDTINSNIEFGYFDTYKAFGYLKGKYYYFTIEEYFNFQKKYSSDILEGIEEAASIFDIDKKKVYKAREFIQLIAEAYENLQERNQRPNTDLTLENLMAVIKSKTKTTIDSTTLLFYTSKIIESERLKGATEGIAKLIASKLYKAACSIIYLRDCSYF